ncbi:Cytochrome P450 2A9 [Hypsibius exemplaris]|uniref:Cytochrome P450 2A9 n=1 Tax=Hypsibius exemplaris TaxID=2072580 RepID=A0A1W0WPZ9_HYPEX|nr:Cytochrome P450 2A9 [Hypsibius exemplaris]
MGRRKQRRKVGKKDVENSKRRSGGRSGDPWDGKAKGQKPHTWKAFRTPDYPTRRAPVYREQGTAQLLREGPKGLNVMNLPQLSLLPLVCVACSIGFLLWHYRRKHKGIPPGPIGLPVLGYVPFLGPHPQDAFIALGKRYGNVFSFYMGSQLTIVLNDYHAVKAAFSEQADTFNGRAGGFVSTYIRQDTKGKTHGLGAPHGKTWKDGRRFMIQTLRDLGMGRSHLQSRIIEEADRLIDTFLQFNGQSFDPAPWLYAFSGSIIGSLLFGPGYDRTDPAFTATMARLRENDQFRALTWPLQCFPWLRHVPGPFKRLWGMVVANTQQILLFMRCQVAEHRSTHPAKEEARDYIQAFLNKQISLQETGVTELQAFEDEELIQSLRGLSSAGVVTSASTMSWLLFYLLHNCHVQEKIHQELDRAIESGQSVTIEDRVKLPYLEAVIREAQRLGNVSPLGLPHTNHRETTLLGHRIPANSFIIANYKAVHVDPAFWHAPHEFDPTRFLDKDGRINEPAHFMPFSIGKRACGGEALARMVLFLFTANILQRLRITGPTDRPLPPSTASVTFLHTTPAAFSMRAFART